MKKLYKSGNTGVIVGIDKQRWSSTVDGDVEFHFLMSHDIVKALLDKDYKTLESLARKESVFPDNYDFTKLEVKFVETGKKFRVIVNEEGDEVIEYWNKYAWYVA